MNIDDIKKTTERLINIIEKEKYKGYDPYDTLNSWIPFPWLGKWGPLLAIQFQKRNPINIRPLLGIKKEINPKAFGLLLQAYSLLYKKTNKQEYLDKAHFFFNWLKNNYSKGYSGYAWGYNFPWANSAKYLEPFVPSAVVTGFVGKGIFEYYKITNDAKALEILKSSIDFLLNDLPQSKDRTGICISYTPIMKDSCYNASLLATDVIARVYSETKDEQYLKLIYSLLDFVVSKQKDDGRWNYSIDLETGKEDKQIDFHQGFVLESIFDIINYSGIKDDKYNIAVKKGLEFYYQQQFFKDGWSKWRYPKVFPVEIHNQAQGIITFSKLSNYSEEYFPFAFKIAEWTINKMQGNKGYFYYQKHKYYCNKISYMRWSQAWMFLALTHLIV